MAPEPDLRIALGRAAASPADPLDVADLHRRARRIRRHRRVGTAAIAVALLGPLTLVGTAFVVPESEVSFLSGGGTLARSPRPQATEHRPSPRPTPSSVPAPTAVPGLTAPSPSASPGTPTPSGTRDGRESYATVTIQDPPGAPERRPDLPGDARHPDVVLTLILEDTQAGPDDVIDGWLDVRNTGDEPVALGQPRCWAVWGLYQDGKWRGGQPDSTCGDKAPTRVLEPGQRWSLSLRFDTRADGADGKRGAALPPGKYQAAAGLRAETREHGYSGVWYAPPVDVTVTAPPAAD